MIDDLVIINVPRGATLTLPDRVSSLQWQTCLRRIIFLHRNERSRIPRDTKLNIYEGRKAYQFLLEVICGLQSPLMGETEVMGQFRRFRNDVQFPGTLWGDYLRVLTTDLLRDARLVRQQYLQGLGSQSYGSLVRKCVKGSTGVALLGTGSLAEEILPWLNEKEIAVRLFYRSLIRARRLVDRYPGISLSHFGMTPASWTLKSSALIVAAPIRSQEITKWIGLQETRFSIVIDLRGEAEEDPLNCGVPVVKLGELFDSLRTEQERVATRTSSALDEIEVLSTRRVHRPLTSPPVTNLLYAE